VTDNPHSTDSPAFDREVERLERDVDRAVASLAKAIRKPRHLVFHDLVMHIVLQELIEGLPELLDWLSGADETSQGRRVSDSNIAMRLAEALEDWRDAKAWER
jgi:hypothetical protein